jgi:putative addiction module component (TIGR02574 family)
MSTGASPSFDSLVTHALALPRDQRAQLAERLWISVEWPIEDESLIAEIEHRDAEMESGAVNTFSHEEVMRDARKAIGE